MFLKAEAVLYKINLRTNLFLSLFHMCIFTCFLFTSVGWCNVQVHLYYTEVWTGFMLFHSLSNLPRNCLNRSFLIRLAPRLVLSDCLVLQNERSFSKYSGKYQYWNAWFNFRFLEVLAVVIFHNFMLATDNKTHFLCL